MRRQRWIVFLICCFLGLLLTVQPIGLAQIPAALSENSGLTTLQLVEQGRVLYTDGEFEQAISRWREANQRFQGEGDRTHQAMVLAYIALAQQQLEQWTAAEAAITASLGLLSSEPDADQSKAQLQIQAQALNVRGRLEFALGRSQQALATWQQTTHLYQQLEDETGVTGSLINQAQVLDVLGFYRRACNTLLDALHLNTDCDISVPSNLQTVLQALTTQPNLQLRLIGLRSLGNTLRLMGYLEHSQHILEQGSQVAPSSTLEQNAILLSLGKTYQARYQQSTTLYDNVNGTIALSDIQSYVDHALNAYQTVIDQTNGSAQAKLLQIQAQLQQLSLLIEWQNWLRSQPDQLDRAASLESQILAQITALQQETLHLAPSQTTVFAQLNFAQSLMRLGSRGENENSSFTSVAQILTAAARQAYTLADGRAESYALGLLGHLYEQDGQWSKAQQFTVQATTLAQSLQAEDIVYQWQWQLGRLLQQQDDREGAIAAYTTATRTLEQVRQNLLTIEPDLQFSFRENVEPLYRELVDLLLKSDDATEPAHENLRQAIRTISELQQAELENFLRCNLTPQQSLDEVDPDPTAAFIYPIILRDRLEVILKLPQGEQYLHYQTPLSRTEINRMLVDLRSGLENQSILPEALDLSQQVYNWLIHPAEVALKQNGVKTLVFLLDGTFRNVPMAALYDGQQYLIERYAIALAPSLQLPQPRPLAALKLDALTFGLSQIRAGFQPHQGFSSLPNVETELAEIRSQIPSQQRLNAAFTADALERMVSTSSEPIIHLATHGQFSSNPEQTFILSWDERIDVNRLSQILRNRNEQSAHPIELLILSACRTADGDDRAALGLAGLAVRLGARSTIASLWDVNDRSTAQLMQVFYQQLASADRALTRAEALRQAQLSLLQAEREGYNVPFFWAPYVLVGNWL